MTNFYCHGASANDTFDRVGTCTDKSGNDPACPLPFLRGNSSSCRSFVFIEEHVEFAHDVMK